MDEYREMLAVCWEALQKLGCAFLLIVCAGLLVDFLEHLSMYLPEDKH